MTTPILVTGGTGTLGRPVAQQLREAGASVTVLSRHGREAVEGIRYTAGDLSTGEASRPRCEAPRLSCTAQAAARAMSRRRARWSARPRRRGTSCSSPSSGQTGYRSSAPSTGLLFGYFGMKLATERVVEQSGIGWTTLRATQFYDLILMVARGLARLPVIPAPTGSRFQPVEVTEVAERMAELALGEPSGQAPDLAGPKTYTLAELVNSYLSAVGKRRPLVPVHIPGQAARAIRAGANLAPDHAVGKRTWEDFLADRI